MFRPNTRVTHTVQTQHVPRRRGTGTVTRRPQYIVLFATLAVLSVIPQGTTAQLQLPSTSLASSEHSASPTAKLPGTTAPSSLQTGKATAAASGSNSIFPSNAERRYADAQAAYETVKTQVVDLTYQRASIMARYKAGAATTDEVNSIESQLKQKEILLNQKHGELDSAFVVAALMTRVNIDFTNADMHVVAGLLARAGNFDLQVASEVPKDIRLTMKAQSIPIAALLEAIGDNAHIMIAPFGRGVLLTNWPTLEVNGTPQSSIGVNAPWSDDWGPNTESRYRGNQWKTLFNRESATPNEATLTLPVVSQRGGSVNAGGAAVIGGPMNRRSSNPGILASATGAPFVVTQWGDKRLVVAEQTQTLDGKPAILLTVYAWEGDHLKRVSSTLHTGERPVPSHTAGMHNRR